MFAPMQGQVQVAGAGPRRLRKVAEGSGRVRKVPVQGQVQVASASSGRSRRVAEYTRRFRRRAKCRLQAQVPEGFGR